jgi:hypothetical protein
MGHSVLLKRLVEGHRLAHARTGRSEYVSRWPSSVTTHRCAAEKSFRSATPHPTGRVAT